jgi:hypothetical protein
MTLEEILIKINNINECKILNKTKYFCKTIWANKTFGGLCRAYIIY